MIEEMLAKKIGMTRTFLEKGKVIPITILKIETAYVLNIISEFQKVKIAFGGDLKKSKITKIIEGQFKKAQIKPKKYIKEVAILDGKMLSEKYKIGSLLELKDIFSEGDRVNIVGLSKGKGFQGVVKRHGFRGGRKTHGSRFHRLPGSIGGCATPSKVFKGIKLPGRMGGKQNTIKNLNVFQVDYENSIISVIGSVVGSNNSIVHIKKSVKK